MRFFHKKWTFFLKKWTFFLKKSPPSLGAPFDSTRTKHRNESIRDALSERSTSLGEGGWRFFLQI